MDRSFGGDHPELGQVTAQRVDGLGALANQKIPRAEHDGGGLLVRAFEGHKAHGRALGGLADGLRIGHVVLLALDERLHVRRRDETDRMAELGDLAAPVVGAATGLHGHRAGRQRGQERQKLAAAQLLAKDHRARAVSPMELKDVFGEIEADGANLVHERLLEWALTPHSGTLRPSGASTWGNRGSESPHRSDRVGAGVEPTAALPIMMVSRGRRAIARAWVVETG